MGEVRGPCFYRADDTSYGQEPLLPMSKCWSRALAEAVGIRGRDIEGLYASPETGATIKHEESGSLGASEVLVWSLARP